jgi:putative flippase GtrA
MPGMVSLRRRLAELIPELTKFGVVGLIGSVIDLGGAAYLHGAVGVGPMVSKGLSIAAATVFTYLGSRFWTFRHRVNQAFLREGTLFVALNVVGLAIAECVIAVVSYGLDMKGSLAYNAASVAGTGLGTIFRYFSYKKWVFLAGVPGAAMAAGEAAVSGMVDPAAETTEAADLLGTPSGWYQQPGWHQPLSRQPASPQVDARQVDARERDSRQPAHQHQGSHRHARSQGQPGAHRYQGAHGHRLPATDTDTSADTGYGPPWEVLDATEAPHR